MSRLMAWHQWWCRRRQAVRSLHQPLPRSAHPQRLRYRLPRSRSQPRPQRRYRALMPSRRLPLRHSRSALQRLSLQWRNRRSPPWTHHRCRRRLRCRRSPLNPSLHLPLWPSRCQQRRRWQRRRSQVRPLPHRWRRLMLRWGLSLSATSVLRLPAPLPPKTQPITQWSSTQRPRRIHSAKPSWRLNRLSP